MAGSKTEFQDVIVTSHDVFRDSRGVFYDGWHGYMGVTFDGLNVSHSRPYVLRGLHYQTKNPQGKMLRCVAGAVFDVMVDIRRSSPTFGDWWGLWLFAEECKSVYIPPGYAHGFVTGVKGATVVYQVTGKHDKESDRAILWNDPDLRIGWPVDHLPPTLSTKDANATLFRNAEVLP